MFTRSKPDIITAVQGLSIHYPGYIIILFLDAVYLSQNSIFTRQISRCRSNMATNNILIICLFTLDLTQEI